MKEELFWLKWQNAYQFRHILYNVCSFLNDGSFSGCSPLKLKSHKMQSKVKQVFNYLPFSWGEVQLPEHYQAVSSLPRLSAWIWTWLSSSSQLVQKLVKQVREQGYDRKHSELKLDEIITVYLSAKPASVSNFFLATLFGRPRTITEESSASSSFSDST